MADLPRDSAPPAEPPHDYAALFAVERDRLTDLLAGLSAGDWQRPSPCPGWSILGLCGHLLGDDFGLLARHRDGHFGTPPPGGATEGEFVAWLDEMQVKWVRASRRLSPRLVTDGDVPPCGVNDLHRGVVSGLGSDYAVSKAGVATSFAFWAGAASRAMEPSDR